MQLLKNVFLVLSLTIMFASLTIAQVDEVGWINHFVYKGETMFSLSRKYEVSLDQIKEWNNLSNLDNVREGTILRIYQPQEIPANEVGTRSLGTSSGNQSLGSLNADAPLDQPAATRDLPPEPKYYEIKKGDTFYGIARYHGLSSDELKAYNPLINSSRLTIGQSLVVGYDNQGNTAATQASPSVGENSRSMAAGYYASQPTSPDNQVVTHNGRSELLEEYHEAYNKLVELRKQFKVYALVVGVSDYPNVKKLRYPDDDAYAFYSFLMSLEGGAGNHENISILVDENATKANIMKEAQRLFSKAEEDDAIVFYYAGHGVENAVIPYDYNGHNALTFAELRTAVQSRSQHRAAFIDACHSGSVVNKYMSRTAQENSDELIFQLGDQFKSSDYWALLSSTSDELSLEVEGKRHGLFTHSLIEGMKGKADVNQDYLVTLREVYDYINGQVRTYSNSGQRPVLMGNFDPNKVIGLVRKK